MSKDYGQNLLRRLQAGPYSELERLTIWHGLTALAEADPKRFGTEPIKLAKKLVKAPRR